MVLIGLWFLLLLLLAVVSVYGSITMILSRHVISGLIVVIVVFISAVLVEVTLLFLLRTQVANNQYYWHQKQPLLGKEIVYVAIGDSAAQGIGASSTKYSYVSLVAANIKQQTGRSVRVINLSRSGAKLDDLLSQQLPKLQGMQPDIVTVDIGANDIAHGTASSVMIEDYKRLIGGLSSYPVVFANLPDFMWGTQQRNTTALNTTIVSLCSQYGLQLADLHQATHAKMWFFNEYAADGFHPSNRGHQTWASSFDRGVRSLLARSTRQ